MKTRTWSLLFAAICVVLNSGCRDKDSDDTTGVVDPGPEPSPDPAPDPDPTPDPDPDPEPEPEPEPTPGPAWATQDAGTQLNFTAVAAIDETRAWAAAGSDLFRTTDGGATWTFISQTPMDGLWFGHPSIQQLKFFDEQHGWAITWESILETTDGGETWTKHEATGEAQYTSMAWAGSSTAWVCANKGAFMKSTDGGQTWGGGASFSPFGGGWFFYVSFADEQTGWTLMWAGSSVQLVKSTDGGSTWTQVAPISGGFDGFQSSCRIETAGANHAWVVSGSLIMATADGSTWNVQNHSGSGLQGVDFVDGNNGWVVGDQIQRTTNGGATWTVQPTPESGFRDVVFVNANVGWVVGSQGVILKTTTGGQ